VLTVARERAQRLLSGDGVATGNVTFSDSPETAVNDHQALKSAFQAGMDPMIRTPLTAMIGFAEILGDEINNPSALNVHDLVDRIRANGQQLLWALDAISNQARLDADAVALRPQPFDVVHDVTDVVETLDVVAREKGLNLSLDTDVSSVYASLDRTAFERIIGHVIVHAIRTSDDGPISIRVFEEDSGPVVAVSGAYETPDAFFGAAQGTTPPAPDVAPAARVVHQLLDRMGGHLVVRSTSAGSTCEIRFLTAHDATVPPERSRVTPRTAVMSS
jgi:signal transduction histidine kinase